MNDHQRFTGIQLPEGESGAWKSLCGTESKDICRIYEEVVGVYPTDDLIGEAKWVLGGSVFYGGAVKCRSLDEYRAWLTEKHGLARQPALEGMSRGGLIIYNWASANPGKVACIYGDAPVAGSGQGRDRGQRSPCSGRMG